MRNIMFNKLTFDKLTDQKLTHIMEIGEGADLSLTETTSASLHCVKQCFSVCLKMQKSPGNSTAPHSRAENMM